MAEPVALGIKPQAPMTLGDMVNIARGAQAFQQSEQANPLALEKARMEIEQAQKMNPLAVSRSETELETARINSLKAGYGLDDTEHTAFAKILGGFAYDPRLKPENIKKNPQGVLDVIHDMKAEGKASGIRDKRLDTVIAPAMAKAMQDPSSVPQYLLNMMTKGMTSAEQRSAGLEKVETTGAGQVIRTTPSTFGETPKVSYENPSGVTPMPNTVELNGIKYEVRPPTTAGGSPTLMPLGGGGQAPTTPRVQNAPSTTTQNAPSAPAPSATSGLVLQDMPVPAGGIPQMNTQQTARYEEGNALKSKSTDLAKAASESKQTTRKIKENIASAAGSAPGQALRSAGKWLAGSEQLDELVKNLAQNQVDQATLMGNSAATDAARSVLGLANGSENITPQALAQIVQRADATSTGLEKFNTGLGNYYQKQGTYNGPIHARNFKDTWAKNYDPRIFMVQNVNSSNISPAEKQIQLQAIMKGTSETERKELAKKAEIIKRLEKGDF
jgi:hypothetical protein